MSCRENTEQIFLLDQRAVRQCVQKLTGILGKEYCMRKKSNTFMQIEYILIKLCEAD